MSADERGSIDVRELHGLLIVRMKRGKIGISGLGAEGEVADEGSIKSLRQTQSSRRAGAVPLHRKVCRFVAECLSLNSLAQVGKSEPMCSNYGHLIDHSKWKTGQPLCSDCGAVITGREQLRGSTPKQRKAN